MRALPEQFAVGQLDCRPCPSGRTPFSTTRPGAAIAEDVRRTRDKQMARLCGGAPHRPRSELDRLAGNGRALVRRYGAVAKDHHDAANATSSSSATICASAVRMPVPRSTWPLKAATPPDTETMTKGSSASALASSTEAPGLSGSDHGDRSRLFSSRRDRAPAAGAPSCAGQRRRQSHGGDDLDMRAASAEIEAQRLADLGLRRIGANWR